MSFINALAKALTRECISTNKGCPIGGGKLNTEVFEDGACTLKDECECADITEDIWLEKLSAPPVTIINRCKHINVCKYKD